MPNKQDNVLVTEFTRLATEAVDTCIDRVNPDKVLKVFRRMYDGHVTSECFRPADHDYYRIIEELLSNIVEAKRAMN